MKAVASTRASAEPQTPDAPAPQTGAVVWAALLSIWIAGALLVLARQGIEIAAVRRLLRNCRPIPDEGWTALLSESQVKLRLRRSVSLLQIEAAIIPMTCGVLRPIVLVPAFSADWSPERRRCVLLHELAHVKRLDVLFQMVARVACGFYWLNPLMWYAAGRLRVERELACDDCVVAAGERASDYAEQLVEIARSCRTWRLAAGVAMARSSKLEGRIVALLDRARSHEPITGRLSLGLALAAALLVTVAAVLEPVARAAVVAESSGQPAKETVEESAPAVERAAKVEPTAGPANSIRGRVSDPQGNPVRGAQIWARRLMSPDWQWRPVATTDARGLFRFDIDPATLAKSLKSNEALSLQIHRKVPIAFAASAAGFGFGLIELAGLTPTREELANVSFPLVKDVLVTGRILTVDGRPASGTSVSVEAIYQPGAATLDEYIRLARQGATTMEERSLIAGVPASMQPGPAAMTLTDQDCRFAISGLGADRIAWLMLRGPSTPQSVIVVITRPVPPGEAE
ncbi:MAG TPA: M56 family metallopeptidase, partial [Planctomycetaceae bacterium]|nr:M56 family metallopeptidase [Planctomycetaceae bacterium]